MKLGVFTTLLSNLSLEEALKYFKSLGIEMVEIGCGGYPGNAHANAEELLNDDAKLEEFKAVIAKYDMQISALSCHGNPVHPNKEIAAEYDKTIRNTILLAEKLGVPAGYLLADETEEFHYRKKAGMPDIMSAYNAGDWSICRDLCENLGGEDAEIRRFRRGFRV